jgi:hypothetical protein
MSSYPLLAYGTPRKLPRADRLEGRVVVLDVAFAGDAGGASFEKVTAPFIRGLGDRLAMWIDHHDHALHSQFADDPRFVLRTKAEHPACPELVTPERVAFAGKIDTICCHVDFDGLCAAAKWIRGGVEPYEGADADARAIDTRLGKASDRGNILDRALRARPRDDGLRGLIVRYLATGTNDAGLYAMIREAASALDAIEAHTRELARRFEVESDLAICDVRGVRSDAYDKTLLLMLGQERAEVSLVHDDVTVTLAARFDSGVDLVAMLGLSGGMPTRVSVAPNELERVLALLRAGRAKTSAT